MRIPADSIKRKDCATIDRERRSIPMGDRGTSLYSGDFARDLRGTIRAVVRLPYDADRLADIVSETEPDAARNPGDEDHTTFWLVLGDQFARYGLKSDRVIATALEIIDSGRDLALQWTLGQTDAGLENRRRYAVGAAPARTR
jgi:hypothetical protein